MIQNRDYELAMVTSCELVELPRSKPRRDVVQLQAAVLLSFSAQVSLYGTRLLVAYHTQAVRLHTRARVCRSDSCVTMLVHSWSEQTRPCGRRTFVVTTLRGLAAFGTSMKLPLVPQCCVVAFWIGHGYCPCHAAVYALLTRSSYALYTDSYGAAQTTGHGTETRLG